VAAVGHALVDLDEATVEEVLQQEESAKVNCRFVHRDESAYSVRQLFAKYELLEAVLITQHGKENESPLGIATRWDMLRLGE
jgi:hypothetical protein